MNFPHDRYGRADTAARKPRVRKVVNLDVLLADIAVQQMMDATRRRTVRHGRSGIAMSQLQRRIRYFAGTGRSGTKAGDADSAAPRGSFSPLHAGMKRLPGGMNTHDKHDVNRDILTIVRYCKIHPVQGTNETVPAAERGHT